jgi:hypothetical protein
MFATEKLHSSELFFIRGKRVNLYRKTIGKFDLKIYENEHEASWLNQIYQANNYSKGLKNGNIICVITTRLARRYFKVILTGFGVKNMRIIEIPPITLLG